MNKTFAVAKWEFIEKVKTKAFIIGLFMTPVIMGLAFLLPKLIGDNEEEKTKIIGIIDQTQWIAKEISDKFATKYTLADKSPAYKSEIIADAEMTLEQLKVVANAKLLSGEIHAYFIIPKTIVDSGVIEYRSENVGNFKDQERFSKIFQSIILEHRSKFAGIDPDVAKKLMTDVDIKTIKVSKEGQEKESGFLETFFTGYIFIILLLFLVMSTGQMLIRSVIEEKTNRIIEVLVSSCTPMELMSGKIYGLSSLGIATVAFWILLLVGVNIFAPVPFVAGGNMIFMLIYFFLGYLMYVAIFITVGSTVTTEQEAQQMTGYVTILLMLPVFMAAPVMVNPNSTLVKVLSLVPLLTPTMMALRLSIQTPQWWEIALSVVLLVLTILGLMWMAGKVFRIGILITGKKPSLKEIYGWLKAD